VIHIKRLNKVLFLIILFFVYNIENIDSNNDKILLYDSVNIHDESNFTIYFKDVINSYDIDHILKGYNIKILSYIVDGEKYYAKDGIDLIDKYNSNKKLEEKIYYELNGVIIEGINVECENNEIIKLSRVEKIY
jgi:hypothetical protein